MHSLMGRDDPDVAKGVMGRQVPGELIQGERRWTDLGSPTTSRTRTTSTVGTRTRAAQSWKADKVSENKDE